MQSPETLPPAAPRSRYKALLDWMASHQKAVHTFELAVFFLALLLQLWGADMLGSWRGWAIAMFGVLLGMALVLRFGARPFVARNWGAD